jgi:hypothetical protein
MIYKPVPGKLNRPPPEDVATHDVHHWALMLLHLTNVPSFILPSNDHESNWYCLLEPRYFHDVPQGQGLSRAFLIADKLFFVREARVLAKVGGNGL